MRHRSTPGSGERGFITVTTLFVLVVVMGLMLSQLYGSLSTRREIKMHESTAHALELAEMALIHSEMEFRAQNDPGGDGVGNIIGQVDADDVVSGTYEATANPVAQQPGLFKVVGLGTKGLSARRLEIGLLVSAPFVFERALSATGSLVMRDNATTDSYDSGTGPWDPQAVNTDTGGQYAGSTGGVAANYSVDLYDGVRVRGDARCGPTFATQIHGLEAESTGDTSSLPAPMTFADPRLLEFEYAEKKNRNDSLELSYDAAYDPTARCLTATGSGTITMPAGTYFFHNFTMDGTSHLIVQGPVRLYVTGELRLGPTTQVTYPNGTDQDPRGMRILAHPYDLTPSHVTPSLPIQIALSTPVSLTVYAPARNILVSGGAHVSGALVGANVEMANDAQVHYDVAVGVPGSGAADTAVIYWRDLNPPGF